jgi:hypothetical protein
METSIVEWMVPPLLPVTTIGGKQSKPNSTPPGQADATCSPAGDGGGDGGGSEGGVDNAGVLKLLRRFVVVSSLIGPELMVADVMALVRLNGNS